MLFVITKSSPPHKRFLFSLAFVGIILGSTTNLTPSQIISVTNAARQTAGLNPVHPNPQLMAAAEAKAKAMFAENVWSHDTPSETPWQFIDNTGYQYFIAGENLARNYDTAQAVVEAWLASPGHRNNLLNPNYVDTGVAIATGDFPDKPNSILVVQYFATKYDAATAATASAGFSLTPLLSGPTTSTHLLRLILLTLLTIPAVMALVILITNFRLLRRRQRQPPSTSHWHR